ncbi:maestro heat-like repeat-containing protein family member 7 [Grus japonensis]|uniref:Maestro heat-like repeat-containing protein family member 7 n=1 Tax=Grus japonensis TaxID=30415 RepID=A0ABC9YKY1_GRUJA
MGNKQEELEATMLLESYDLVAITETWWAESHDWSAAIDGYNLFRRDRISKCLEALEWNGMEWNGIEWNGMEWNGME